MNYKVYDETKDIAEFSTRSWEMFVVALNNSNSDEVMLMEQVASGLLSKGIQRRMNLMKGNINEEREKRMPIEDVHLAWRGSRPNMAK